MTGPPYFVTVIADDLTGAASIGGEFSNHGLRAFVTRQPSDFVMTAAARIFDTGSRFVDTIEAQRRVREATGLARLQSRLTIKKVDSRFTGNSVAEVQEFCAIWRRPIIVSPACPAAGWSTRDGRQIHSSRGGVDLLDLLFDNEAMGQPATLDLGVVRQGPSAVHRHLDAVRAQVIVADAETTEDLASVVRGGIGAGVTGFVGTYGMGTAVVQGAHGDAYGAAAYHSEHRRRGGGRVLVLVGSTDVQAQRQVENLRSHGAEEVVVNVAAALRGEAAEPTRVGRAVMESGGEVVLVHTLPGATASVDVEPLSSPEGDITAAITPCLASAARAAPDAQLLVVGGETAGNLADALGLDPLFIVQELYAGIPVSHNGGTEPRWLITKPGSFGDETALSEVVSRLLGRQPIE